jgi:serine/threonine-protein kinase
MGVEDAQLTSLPIGSTFAGYRIERLIDRGGMGVVYLAEDRRLRRKVALKLIAPEWAADPAYRHRFLLESDLLGELEHPNIVTIHAAGEWHDQLYLAMRYVEGTSLARLLATRGALDLGPSFALVRQIGEALDAAHARGIVHRDVKPANVLVSTHGRAYLTDFGLTRRTTSESDVTTTGAIVGTVGYMAPERFTGESVDRTLVHRADVYALGCVLMACLTAREPFPRDSREATMWAHVHAPPPRPSATRPDLPAAVDDVVATALAKDPADRYATAGALVDALRLIVGETAGRPAVDAEPTPAPITEPVPSPVPSPLPLPASIRVGVRAPLLTAVPHPPMAVGSSAWRGPGSRADQPEGRFANALKVAAAIGVVASLLFALGVIGRDARPPGHTPPVTPNASSPPDAMTGLAISNASPASTSVAGRLLARIPIRDDCVQAIPQQPVAAAEYRCTYPHERQEVRIAYDAFAGEAPMNQAWAAALAADRFHAGAGRCPERAGETAFYLSNDPLRQEAGRLLCYVASDRSAVISWTLRDHGVIATAIRSDGDLHSLYDLWASGTLNTIQDRR